MEVGPKLVSLELGGKNAMVVLDDADLDLVLDGALFGAFGTSGQRCTSTSRLIVQQRHRRRRSSSGSSSGRRALRARRPARRRPPTSARSSRPTRPTASSAMVDAAVAEGATAATGGALRDDVAGLRGRHVRRADDPHRRQAVAHASPARRCSARCSR